MQNTSSNLPSQLGASAGVFNDSFDVALDLVKKTDAKARTLLLVIECRVVQLTFGE